MKDPVIQAGAVVLRTHAKPVAKKDFGSAALGKLLKHMSNTLKKEQFGVAIAAPQVGESLRIFVVAGKVFAKDEDEEEDKEEQKLSKKSLPDKVFINPEISKLSRKKHEMSEGCLSVRGIYGTVMRHEKVSIKAWDENGKAFTYNGTGLVAHIFQHEMDHLEGILFTDKATKLEHDKK